MAILRLHAAGRPALEFDRDRTLVGRDPACDVVLEDKSISRRHAMVERRGPSWHVVDQGSANGTFVNGQQVADAELRDGQELRLGTYGLRVEVESEAPQTILMSAGAVRASAVPTAAFPAPPPVRGPAPAAPAAARASGPVPGAGPPPAPAASRSPQMEGAQILGLPPGASAQEVGERYREAAADLEAKLATAPTPHLRAMYQRKLDELRGAARAMSPGFVSEGDGVSVEDLPSAQPVVVSDAIDDIVADARSLAPVREPAYAKVEGPSRATTLLGGLAVLLLCMSGYFWMSGGRTDRDLAALAKSSEYAAARTDWLNKYQPIDQLEKDGVLRNGSLKLCNRGAQPVTVAWLGAVSVETPPDPSQAFAVRTYNSAQCRGDFKLTIPPGAEQAISFESSNEKCRWNGQGVYYAMHLPRPAPTPVPAPSPGEAARAAQPARTPEASADPYVYQSGLLNGRQECVTIGEGS